MGAKSDSKSNDNNASTAPDATVKVAIDPIKNQESHSPDIVPGADDGFQARRHQWAQKLCVHILAVNLALEIGRSAIGIILSVKSTLGKAGWDKATWAQQTQLLDSEAQRVHPELAGDSQLSSAQHVRAFILTKGLMALLGESAGLLSYRLVSKYLIGLLLKFNPIDLETLAKNADDKDEASKVIRTDWIPWIKSEKSGLRRYLDDPRFSQAELLLSAKEWATELASSKNKKDIPDPATAEKRKQERERAKIKSGATDAIASALSGGVMTPQEMIQEAHAIAKHLGISIPEATTSSFDPSKATKQDCLILLAAMERSGNIQALEFMAKASQAMMERVEKGRATMADLLATPAQPAVANAA